MHLIRYYAVNKHSVLNQPATDVILPHVHPLTGNNGALTGRTTCTPFKSCGFNSFPLLRLRHLSSCHLPSPPLSPLRRRNLRWKSLFNALYLLPDLSSSLNRHNPRSIFFADVKHIFFTFQIRPFDFRSQADQRYNLFKT